MIFKNKLLEIDEDDIFGKDKLERKDAIENLSSLLVATKEPLTMSINADWGAGKTTFVKMWQAHLKKQHKVQSIYFSAWEDDFSKEPLISILGELSSYIDEKLSMKSEIKEGFEKAKELGGKIIKRGLPALIKGATGGILDLDKGFEDAIGAITEQATKELIEKYSKEKEITEKFKGAIQEILQNIDKDKPFVIFIDELDRCRPIYAIELLERIKHIFGIEGLIFVLSIDKKQLAESIKSQYGNIDTDNYLRRFIDLEYSLKNPSVDKFCDALYANYKVEKILSAKNINEGNRDFSSLSMLKYLAKSFGLTLREIEQIFLQISIVFKTVETGIFETRFRVFVFFIVLKSKDFTLYEKLINGKAKSDEVKERVLLKNSNSSNRDMGTIIEAIILATGKSQGELDKIVSELEKRPTEEHKQSKWLINLLNHTEGWDYRLNNVIDTAIKKIEFLDKFNFEGLSN